MQLSKTLFTGASAGMRAVSSKLHVTATNELGPARDNCGHGHLSLINNIKAFYLTGSFLIARMKVRYSPNHYLLLATVIYTYMVICTYICICYNTGKARVPVLYVTNMLHFLTLQNLPITVTACYQSTISWLCISSHYATSQCNYGEYQHQVPISSKTVRSKYHHSQTIKERVAPYLDLHKSSQNMMPNTKYTFLPLRDSVRANYTFLLLEDILSKEIAHKKPV